MKATIFTLIFFGLTQAFASGDWIAVDGQITDASGSTPLESSNVDFTLEIYDPSGQCLIYSEVHSSVDMSGSLGYFNLKLGLGSSTGSPAGNTFAVAMSNNDGPISGTGTCPNSTTFDPATESNRVIKVSYNDIDGGSGPQTLGQNIEMGYAQTAKYSSFSNESRNTQRLDGILASGYPKLGSYTQSSFDSLLSNEPAILSLLGNIPSSVPTNGSDIVNKNYVDSVIGAKLDTSGGTVGPLNVTGASTFSGVVTANGVNVNGDINITSGSIDLNGGNINNIGSLGLSSISSPSLNLANGSSGGALTNVASIDAHASNDLQLNSSNNILIKLNGSSNSMILSNQSDRYILRASDNGSITVGGTNSSSTETDGRINIYRPSVGYSVSEPISKLDIRDTSSSTTAYIRNDGANNTTLKLVTGGSNSRGLAVEGGVVSAYFSNDVGIGTTAPTEKLEVNGNIKANEFISTSCSNGFTAVGAGAAKFCVKKISGIIEDSAQACHVEIPGSVMCSSAQLRAANEFNETVVNGNAYSSDIVLDGALYYLRVNSDGMPTGNASSDRISITNDSSAKDFYCCY